MCPLEAVRSIGHAIPRVDRCNDEALGDLGFPDGHDFRVGNSAERHGVVERSSVADLLRTAGCQRARRLVAVVGALEVDEGLLPVVGGELGLVEDHDALAVHRSATRTPVSDDSPGDWLHFPSFGKWDEDAREKCLWLFRLRCLVVRPEDHNRGCRSDQYGGYDEPDELAHCAEPLSTLKTNVLSKLYNYIIFINKSKY